MSDPVNGSVNAPGAGSANARDAGSAVPPSLFAYARAEATRFAAGGLFLALTNGLGLVIPWLLKSAIDALHAHSADALQATARLALAIVVFAATQAATRTASRVLIFNGGREIEYRLRGRLFAHLLALPQSFHRKHPTGELMSRLTSDLGAVRMLFGPGILNIINTTIVYATGLWLMATLNPRLTLFALIPLPLIVAVARLAGRRIYAQSRALQTELADLSAHIQEDLTGVAVMRAYTLDADRLRKFTARNDGFLESSLALARTRGTLGPLFAVTGSLGTLVVLWFGGKEVIAGRMTVGALVAFNAYLAYLAWPTLALGWVLSLWQRGLAGWDRVRQILDEPPLAVGAALPGDGAVGDAAAIEARRLTIEIDGHTALRDVSFVVPRGKTIAVVGPTGAGKTTLADALVRLCDVPEGQLFVDGKDVTRTAPADLRRRIAYAPQDPFLFSATIADNIAFGRHDDEEPEVGSATGKDVPIRAPQPAIRDAALAAGLARDLAEFPDDLATLVGERGITLSGGQRQRVALARALCADAEILVLDDSLSSVDAETEHDILTRLRPKLRGRTTMIISHRVAAVRDADRIVVIDAGRVVESGTHDELRLADGTYARLYREQLFTP